jgi:hypothetical protein
MDPVMKLVPVHQAAKYTTDSIAQAWFIDNDLLETTLQRLIFFDVLP